MNQPKVAVVTGASSGIGRATAIEFARHGWSVVTHGHLNLAGLEETQRQILAIVGKDIDNEVRAAAYVSDIASGDSSQRVVDAVFERYSRVDAWVNAAGADVLTGPTSTLSFAEKLARLWAVDVQGTMVLSRLVAHRMMLQPTSRSVEKLEDAISVSLPSIVHLGWDQAEHGMEGDSGQFFSAIKAAVSAFSKSLAKSVGPSVRINCVAPGWVQTEWGASAPENWQQRATGESILGRWATPNDIARVIVSVVSSDLAFINGQTIAVNGGWQSMSLSIKSETHWTR